MFALCHQCFTEAQAQQLISLDLKDTGLTIQSILELEKHVHRLTSLEHLNLSDNRLIRFVPFCFMNFVAALKSFMINFVLPPVDHLNDTAGARSDSIRIFCLTLTVNCSPRSGSVSV